jgi:hypothetical protein
MGLRLERVVEERTATQMGGYQVKVEIFMCCLSFHFKIIVERTTFREG